MSYKGYVAGQIEFDEDAGLFSGTVAGLRDVVHFAGRPSPNRDAPEYGIRGPGGD
jgi:predicted HicB family RNase H-like nuclease